VAKGEGERPRGGRAGGSAIGITLTSLAQDILNTDAPAKKADFSLAAAKHYRAEYLDIGDAMAPERPARPEHPTLRAPKDMPRRRLGRSPEQRIALLHAVAHIELNAIDLAWDLITRFTHENPPRAFYDDWVQVAEEEAKHFLLLASRLNDLGAAYGDLPAHDGLWQAAEDTAHDLLDRLAVVPLVLEARGLDVTPVMIERMKSFDDPKTAEVLQIIYSDEIGHVAIGKRWFDWICGRRDLDPVDAWRQSVRAHFKGKMKAPLNEAARAEAGFPVEHFAGALARP
jgi:uncharacterized ferritin-like protein (DUF455 family)